jgi:uncharacterized protein (DUF486 family)
MSILLTASALFMTFAAVDRQHLCRWPIEIVAIASTP